MLVNQLRFIANASFEAARSIEHDAAPSRERSLHGHSFLARVSADGDSQDFMSLKQRLENTAAILDYQFLNDHIAEPSDTELAFWLNEKFADLEGVQCAVRSSYRRGAFVEFDGGLCIWQSFRFEAAHWLPNVPVGHQCARMHGHGFEVFLYVKLGVTSEEVAILPRLIDELKTELDGRTLNHISGLTNPTSELLAVWIWERCHSELSNLLGVTVMENSSSGCHYNGLAHQIWTDIYFEAAVPALPSASSREVLGHSYCCRLYLSSAVDEILGWTVDYGDVKLKFDPIYKQLDHHFLADLADIKDTSLEMLVYWIKEKAISDIPLLSKLDLYETPKSGVSLILSKTKSDRDLLFP